MYFNGQLSNFRISLYFIETICFVLLKLFVTLYTEKFKGPFCLVLNLSCQLLAADI